MVHQSPVVDDIPAHKDFVFSPRKSRHVLVVPVLDEGERFLGQLRRIAALGLGDDIDVVVVDGGSKDGSTEHAVLAGLGVRRLLVKTGPGRLSAQLRIGYRAVLDDGYEGIVTIDGNGKDSVESIPLFQKALDEGVDYAQASRYAPGGSAVNTPVFRDLAIRLVHAPVLSIAAGRRFRDTTQGFRAYSARYLSDPRVRPFRDVFVAYELLTYLTVRASQIGMRTREIPTVRTYPEKGRIPTKITFGGSFRLLGNVFATAFRRYHPR